MALGSSDYKIKIAALVEGLRDLERMSDELGDVRAEAGKSIPDPTDKLEGGAQEATQALGGLKTAVTTLFAAFAAGGAIGKIIEAGNNFEKFSAQLETATGSSQLAEESLSWITEFAATTPYEVGEITRSFIKLKSRGIDPLNDGTLATIGDTAAAMGKDLDQAVEALADAMTGEYERLKDFGIKARVEGDKVLFAYRENGRDMVKEADRNSQSMIESTIRGIWNDRYAGQMEKFSTTFAGMSSNAADTFTQSMTLIANNGVLDALKDQLGGLMDQIQAASDNGELQAWAENTGAAIGKMINIIGDGAGFLIEHREAVGLLLKLYVGYKAAATAAAAAQGLFNAALAAGKYAQAAAGIGAVTTQTKLLSKQLLAARAGMAGLAVLVGYEAGKALASLLDLKSEAQRLADEALTESKDLLEETGRALEEGLQRRIKELEKYRDAEIQTAEQIRDASLATLQAHENELQEKRELVRIERQLADRRGDSTLAMSQQLDEIDRAIESVKSYSSELSKLVAFGYDEAMAKVLIQFDELTDAGQSATDVVTDMLKAGIQAPETLGTIAGALESLVNTHQISVADMAKATGAALDTVKDEQLPGLLASIQTMEKVAGDGADRLGKIAEAIGKRQAKALGVDLVQLEKGYSEAEAVVLKTLGSIVSNTELSQSQIEAAIIAGTGKLTSAPAFTELKQLLIDTYGAGSKEVEKYGKAVEAATAKNADLAAAARETAKAQVTAARAAATALRAQLDTLAEGSEEYDNMALRVQAAESEVAGLVDIINAETLATDEATGATLSLLENLGVLGTIGPDINGPGGAGGGIRRIGEELDRVIAKAGQASTSISKVFNASPLVTEQDARAQAASVSASAEAAMAKLLEEQSQRTSAGGLFGFEDFRDKIAEREALLNQFRDRELQSRAREEQTTGTTNRMTTVNLNFNGQNIPVQLENDSQAEQLVQQLQQLQNRVNGGDFTA